jgi:cystathionine beta-lyase/cystathionine gamma-synthase
MTEEQRRAGPSTRAVHAGSPPWRAGEPVVLPVYQTATFFSHPEGADEVRYTRYLNNPNHTSVETRIAALEGAEDCVLLGSGMAAIACALLGCVEAGDHIVAARALYGGTRALLDRELPRLGIETTYVDFSVPEWVAALRENTRVVVAESPTNPLLRVLDLAAIARETGPRGLPLLVDVTFATPINFRALEHGADLVVHSATKYLSGHSDVTAGVVAGSAALLGGVRDRARIFGPVLDPHAAFLLERGIKTLAVRMERHNQNGMALARWAETHPAVARVAYPGLESHPDHALASRVLEGFGGMVGIELKGGGEAATRFVQRLRLARLAPSLGGVETLVSEPRHTSHAGLGAGERAALAIPDGFVRFSFGIEDAEDLIADLQQALAD